MNDVIERLRTATTAYQPVWDGDLHALVHRAHLRRLKVAALGATVTTALAAVLALPTMSGPQRLGVTAERAGIEQRPDRPVLPEPGMTGEDAAPGTTPAPGTPAPGTTPVPGTAPAPGVPGVPGEGGPGGPAPAGPGVVSPAPSEPAPSAAPTQPAPTIEPTPTAQPTQPTASPAQQWWERYDSPEPDPGVYRNTTFGPAPYYSRSYGDGDAATYCTHPPGDPTVPYLPGEPRQICGNFWYGIDSDADTFVVMHSACVPEDDPTWTYDYEAGQENDLYLWDDSEGMKDASTAIYTWSKHVTAMPAHQLSIEPGDCMQYVWHLDLRDDAGTPLDPTRRYLIGGAMHGGWNWYGEEFQP